LKSTNLLERLNEELKRRTLLVRIFPNAASCLRLSRPLAVEMHENWIEATGYLNMDLLKGQQKEHRAAHRRLSFARLPRATPFAAWQNSLEEHMPIRDFAENPGHNWPG